LLAKIFAKKSYLCNICDAFQEYEEKGKSRMEISDIRGTQEVVHVLQLQPEFALDKINWRTEFGVVYFHFFSIPFFYYYYYYSFSHVLHTKNHLQQKNM
jgi:hypothetical protein